MSIYAAAVSFKQSNKKSLVYGFTSLLLGSMLSAGVVNAAEVESSIARGGVLYDKWYKVIGVDAPAQSHREYPADKKYAKKPGSNWRCKECHSWDYLGKDGGYSSGKHFTGIKGIQGAKGADTGVEA